MCHSEIQINKLLLKRNQKYFLVLFLNISYLWVGPNTLPNGPEWSIDRRDRRGYSVCLSAIEYSSVDLSGR